MMSIRLYRMKRVIPLLFLVLLIAMAIAFLKMVQPVTLRPLDQGLMPQSALTGPLHTPATTEYGRSIIETIAKEPLPDWHSSGKGNAPRNLLAKLAIGHDVAEANTYLMQQKPWAEPGSTWLLHQNGDYDFTLAILTTLLFTAGNDPERLYPETLGHLLDVLLVLDGGTPQLAVPNTLGFVRETENHILMMESSRYLKNQWLHQHGNTAQRLDPHYDNAANGLEAWFMSHLDELDRTGFHEFNSIPYLAYTFHPLMNMASYAQPPELAAKARNLIDQANCHYALGSLGFRRCAPFRRQPRYANETRLMADPHTAFMRIWASDPALAQEDEPPHRTGQMLIAAITKYTLPDSLVQWTLDKPHEYLALIGRNKEGSPEIHGGGPGYLISAGGAGRGKLSQIVPRPIALLLEDGATNLDACFHIKGKGPYWRQNNTGVHQRFACGNGSVSIPKNKKPVATAGEWQVYDTPADPMFFIAIHSKSDLGIIALFPNVTVSAEVLARQIAERNPPQKCRHEFERPDGTTIAFDVDAPVGLWPVRQIDGSDIDREYDQWPKLSGNIPPLDFSRS